MIDQILTDYDGKPLYRCIIGRAGTGKSYMAKQWADSDSSYVLTATTGIAATNLGAGTTINSLLWYEKTDDLEESYRNGQLLFRITDLMKSGVRRIIIDEMSMMDGRQLDLICHGLDEANNAYFHTSESSLDFDTKIGLTLLGDFCLLVGTKVMMADGALLPVEAVKEGMCVMGPDSKPRNVLRTTRGVGEMYCVEQTNGDDYLVNSKHKIALKRSNDGKRADQGRDVKRTRYPNTVDAFSMVVTQLAQKSRRFRACFVGYKAGLIRMPKRSVTLDPYFLGLWLGDGDSGYTRITTTDCEVISYCKRYAKSLGLTTKEYSYSYRNGKGSRICISHGRALGNKPNVLMEKLRSYKLVDDKHIPEDFLLNSVDVRLKLLAGLLDSDGSWDGKRYQIASARIELAQQIKQLVDQLGFRTGMHRIKHGYYKGRDDKQAWTVSIGGDTWRIPCRVERKKSTIRSLGRNRLTSVLTIRSAGNGKYAGFTTDGDNLFLLGDGTVTHNCQLSPIDRDRQPKFCFEVDSWERFAPNITHLTKIHRQADPDFIEALRLVRCGDGEAALDYFKPMIHSSLDNHFEGTTAMPHNLDVNRMNQISLDGIDSPYIVFKSHLWGEKPREWNTIPNKLYLKLGALIMILNNKKRDFTTQDQSRQVGESPFSYVNGDLGTLVAADPEGNTARVKLYRTGEVVQVNIHQREYAPPTKDPKSGKMKRKVKGVINYIPIRVAHASTFHKLQGLTLDRVQVEFRKPFCGMPGMMYVALSRARNAEGLRLVGSSKLFVQRCNANPKLREWM